MLLVLPILRDIPWSVPRFYLRDEHAFFAGLHNGANVFKLLSVIIHKQTIRFTSRIVNCS